MKKIRIASVVVILLAFTQQMGIACSGDHWVTNNMASFTEDFFNNCCAGSQVTVFNLQTGSPVTLQTAVDGDNASCFSGA